MSPITLIEKFSFERVEDGSVLGPFSVPVKWRFRLEGTVLGDAAYKGVTTHGFCGEVVSPEDYIAAFNECVWSLRRAAASKES